MKKVSRQKAENVFTLKKTEGSAESALPSIKIIMAHRGFPHPAVRHLFPPLNIFGKEVKSDLNTSRTQSPPQKSSSYTLHAVKSTYFFHFVRLHATKSAYFFHFVRLHTAKSTYFFHFVRLHTAKSTYFFPLCKITSYKKHLLFPLCKIACYKKHLLFPLCKITKSFYLHTFATCNHEKSLREMPKDYVKHKTV